MLGTAAIIIILRACFTYLIVTLTWPRLGGFSFWFVDLLQNFSAVMDTVNNFCHPKS